METKNVKVDSISERELIFSRLLRAPRELVFEVWTNPEHIVQWWGPVGFTTTNLGMEVRTDGQWRFTMHGPDGRDYHNKIIFLEVIKPERLVYKHAGEADTEDVNFHVTVTFDAVGDKTQLTMRMLFSSKEELERVAREYGAIEGAQQTMDRLEEHVSHLSPDDFITSSFLVTRELNAPRDLVFKVFSEAKHLAQWWGPKGMNINVTKLDFRPGGIFLYTMTAANGYTMWGRFIYRHIQAPEKIVFINSFSNEQGEITRAPFPGPWPLEMLNVITLAEQNGKTLLTLRGGPINATAEEHNIYNQNFSSMQEGFGGTLDQLEDYLKIV